MARLEMFPEFTVFNQTYVTLSDAVIWGNESLGTWVCPDFKDLPWSQLALHDLRALVLSVALNPIQRVIGIITPPKVCRVEARRIVAGMQRVVVGWLGTRSAVEHQRQLGYVPSGSFYINKPVVLDSSKRPLPAPLCSVAIGKSILEKGKFHSNLPPRTYVERVTVSPPSTVVHVAPRPSTSGFRAAFNRALAIGLSHRFLLNRIGLSGAVCAVPALFILPEAVVA